MTVCLETGEVVGETLLTVSCRSRLRGSNPETGEAEKKERPFRIPLSANGSTSPARPGKKSKNFCGGRYVVTLAIVTLMMFAPAFGVSVWVFIEGIYHLYTHTRPNMYRHPFHQFFFANFCSYCQDQTRMDKIGRLQDRRYRHYISNLPIGT